MNYYQRLELLSTADIGIYFLWQKIYQQIHLALVKNKIKDDNSLIGLGFPEYDSKKNYLGKKLCLYADTEQLLKQIHCEKWLERLRDYVQIQPIAPTPENIIEYACFRHVKPKGSKDKLARRRAKRKGETFEQALAYYSDYQEQRSRLPYINMTSQTNGHRFRLFIEKQQKEREQKGFFSCYGLSNTTTVPLF